MHLGLLGNFRLQGAFRTTNLNEKQDSLAWHRTLSYWQAVKRLIDNKLPYIGKYPKPLVGSLATAQGKFLQSLAGMYVGMLGTWEHWPALWYYLLPSVLCWAPIVPLPQTIILACDNKGQAWWTRMCATNDLVLEHDAVFPVNRKIR